MKNVLVLLLVVGAVFAVWQNRDRFAARFNPTAAKEAESGEGVAPGSPGSPAAPTPHPAKEARLAATNAYPALSIPNSAFNKKFLALYAEAQLSDPQLLAQPNWPIKLAERTAIALGGAPMPIPGTPAKVRHSQMQGSALDQRPQ